MTADEWVDVVAASLFIGVSVYAVPNSPAKLPEIKR